MSNDYKIGALIVTYNPDFDLLKHNINSIKHQVEIVRIVDNGSKNVPGIMELKNSGLCDVIINPKNEGLAKALNQGFDSLINDGCNWIITLDQDTSCPNGMVDSFKQFTKDDVGIICPAVFYKGINYKMESNLRYEEIEACMTSANMVRVEAWKRVKGFNEAYFIDYIDNDFCMKLRLAGYRIIRDWTKYITHELGSGKEYHFGKKVIIKTIHSPIRYYYMTRNNLYFIRRYKKHINIVKEYIKLVYVIGRELPFTDNKIASLHYTIKGIKDYRNDKNGEIEE